MAPYDHFDQSESIDNRQHNSPEQKVGKHEEQQMPLFSGFERIDELCFDDDPSPFQLSPQECAKLRSIHSEILELFSPEEEESLPSALASFRTLNKCRSSIIELNSETVKLYGFDISCSKVDGRSVSEIVRSAGEKFIRFRSAGVDDLLELSHVPSDEKTEDAELVIQHLLSAADNIGKQQFKRGSDLLKHCIEYSSNKGNPVQRLVYYFTAALSERIEQEMGARTFKLLPVENEECIVDPSTICLSVQQRIPFGQIMQFTGMQTILETVAKAKKIHIVDLDINFGMHCPIFIQGLASRQICPVEHLKMTAVGTASNIIPAETGKRLTDFAESMNLSFSFHVVNVADMLDLNENLFELDPDEVSAVYSPYFLWTMIGQQDRLECLMRVIRSINPLVMVVIETEVNHNSPVFVNRFVEALFFFAAYFDCFGEYMGPDDPIRFASESMFGHGIKNVVAAEGKERIIRQVKNNVWVSFFGHFKMVQKELSSSCLYQASLVAKKFNCEASCSLNLDGNSFILGWKGTSVHSLSAWEFL